jgi:hypothetical protein
MVDATSPFNDGRGQYPDRIAAAAPRGFRDEVKRAAAAERITMGEFVRRAIVERIGQRARDDDDPGPFRPASGQRLAA